MSKCLFAAAILAVLSGEARAETAADFIKADNPRTVLSVADDGHGVGTLLVGVKDDGSNRDGLATALCQSVAARADAPKTIRIMDNAAAQRGQWKALGRAFCERAAKGEVVEFN